MSISVAFNPVRNFTATDVYHYTTLDRPIADLKSNDDLLAAALVKCVDKTGDTITGVVAAPTPSAASNTPQIANTAFIYNELHREAADYTVATQAAGNNTALVASTAFVQNTVGSISGTGLGYNQTWRLFNSPFGNSADWRSANITYYNTTGKPIMVTVSGYLAVDDAYFGIWSNNGYPYIVVSAIVPPGSSYSGGGDNSSALTWAELR